VNKSDSFFTILRILAVQSGYMKKE